MEWRASPLAEGIASIKPRQRRHRIARRASDRKAKADRKSRRSGTLLCGCELVNSSVPSMMSGGRLLSWFKKKTEANENKGHAFR